jgi:glycosyltransferase involved in cell wall biosynthesis
MFTMLRPKKNKVWRMFDMIIKTIKYAKKVDYVLIDWGIPYLLEQNVNLLLVDDDDGMKNKLNNFLQNQIMPLIYQKNGKKSVERFDWEIVKKE